MDPIIAQAIVTLVSLALLVVGSGKRLLWVYRISFCFKGGDGSCCIHTTVPMWWPDMKYKTWQGVRDSLPEFKNLQITGHYFLEVAYTSENTTRWGDTGPRFIRAR